MAAVQLEVLGSNFTKVILGTRLTLWFSYNTCIAFMDSKGDVVAAGASPGGTKWSNTTKKHLNQVPGVGGHAQVIGYKPFLAALDEACTGAGLTQALTQG